MKNNNLEYSTFFRNLIIGRQQEFMVYLQIYRASQKLFGHAKLNIYDQITDIDGVDFIIRYETKSSIHFIEAQVKKTKGTLTLIDRKGNDIKSAIERSNKKKSPILFFAVDHNKKDELQNIYYFTKEELQPFLINKSKSLQKIIFSIERDTRIETFADFIKLNFL